jgi:thymidylate synthase
MKQYLTLLENILNDGRQKEDRTGTGTISLFGTSMRFDLNNGFPAITTKKLAWKAVVSELLWFLSGSSNERDLCELLHGTRDESKTTIWTANANSDYWKSKAKFGGDCGRIYGVQMRSWMKPNGETVDQISNLIETIKKDPSGRRHMIVNFNPGELDQMCLPPCHCLAQFDVTDGKLSCQLYQRSADTFLGVPFNIASYSLLTYMIAQVCGLKVGDFIHAIGDTHLYLNHIDQVREQLSREPLQLPKLWLNPEIDNIFAFGMNDVKLIDYHSYDAISAQMAI